MKLYLILSFAAFFLHLQAAGYFLLFMPRSRINLLFVAIASLFATHSLSVYILQMQSTLQAVYMADQIGTTALALSALAFNWLFYELQQNPNPLYRKSIILVLLPLTTITLFLYIKDLETLKFYFRGGDMLWLFFFDQDSALSLLSVLLVGLSGLLAIMQVYSWDLSARTNLEQLRSRSVLIAVVYFAIVGLAVDFAWPVWSVHILPPSMHMLAVPLMAAMFFALYGQTRKIIPDHVMADIAIKKINHFLLFLDEQGHVTVANQHFLAATGYSMDELQKLGVEGLTRGQELQVGSARTSLKIFAIKDEVWSFRTKEGFSLEARIQLHKLYDRFGRFAGAVIIGKDVREQVWLKKQLGDCRQKKADLEVLVNKNQEACWQREKQLALTESRLDRENHQVSRHGSGNKQMLSEKEQLISEMHHRVKNNMQIFISLAGFTGSAPQCPGHDRDVFTSIIERVKRVALIHDMVYAKPSLSEINFGQFLHELISYKKHPPACLVQPQIRMHAHQVFITVGKAIPTGIIAEELIDNACRHAFAGFDNSASGSDSPFVIWVDFSRKGDYFSLRVRDNGTGMPANHEGDVSGKTGLHLVRMLVKEHLNGQVKIDRSFGTSVEVTFAISGP